jgi:hypothetical protein
MAKDSLAKASTPEPWSASRTSNWVARAGGLPDYIQHISHDLHDKRGMDESRAIAMAVGIVKRWCRGGGNVDANTRAAACKAASEWEALKAKNASKSVKEGAIDFEALDIAALSADDRRVLEGYEPPAPSGSPLQLPVAMGDLQVLETWGQRIAADRAAITAASKSARTSRASRSAGRTRSGAPASSGGGNFEAVHPRGRGGMWVAKGSSGMEVRGVQRRVNARVDGQFGDRTKAAVEAFQRAHGLKVDGIVGRQTVAAFRGRRDAKRVKVGKLSGADRQFLAGHVRGRGRSRLQEAITAAVREAALATKARGSLPASAFVFPGEKRYPIHDEAHARNALARCSGKPEEAQVKAAVYKRYPQLKPSGKVQEAATGALALRLGADSRLVDAPDGDQPAPLDLTIREQADLELVETAVHDGARDSTFQDLAVMEAAPDPSIVKFNADGTVDMVLLRPCNGRGVGRRIYEASVLQRDAGKFAGLPMYDNHESEAAKRARQGLPRAPSELAGEIRESWWDPAFTTPHDAQFDFGRGGVIGRCMLTEDMEKLVRRLPHAVKVSVATEATGLRPGVRNGKRGLVVEGFVCDPEQHSVDLVTRAGAGGAVASLYRELAAA